MTPVYRTHRARFERGLTLIELMVSVTIGLVLMIAIASAYIGSSGASKLAEVQGRMNEDAQAALSILAQQIRMAGDNPRRPDYADADRRNPAFTAASYFIRGCDGQFSDVTTAPDIPSLTCGTTQPHSLAISYEADTDNTIPTSGGAATDCLGRALPSITGNVSKWNGVASVPTAITYTVADNRFYVTTPTGATATVTNVPSLYCKGNGSSSTTEPLVENIEDLQFIYGTAPSTGTLTMAGFLSANGVETSATLALLPDSPSRWARVMSVRICVLARSTEPVFSDSESAAYVPCFATAPVTPTDTLMRHAYYSTVVLRNRVPASP